MLQALGFVLLGIFSLHCALPRWRHRLVAGAHDGRGDVIEGVLGLVEPTNFYVMSSVLFVVLALKLSIFFVSSDRGFFGLLSAMWTASAPACFEVIHCNVRRAATHFGIIASSSRAMIYGFHSDALYRTSSSLSLSQS